MFEQLDNNSPRWKLFAASYVFETATLCVAIVATVMAPRVVKHAYGEHVQLAPPPIFQPALSKPPKRLVVSDSEPRPTPMRVTPVPNIVVSPTLIRKKQFADVPAPKVPVATIDNSLLDKIPGPKTSIRAVVTNAFGSSAPPTLPTATPISKVQTGGFGNLAATQISANAPAGKLAAPKVGSFDLPNGAAEGNGAGAAGAGKKGTVANAGFGNGIAVGTGPASAATKKVQATNFTQEAQPTFPSKHQLEQPRAKPVVIISKPVPAYTNEAKKLRIQGEVLVRVLFTATGKVRVIGVVRGLGHGLDESAVRASEQVRFQPAQRDGQPADFESILHIVFQLS